MENQLEWIWGYAHFRKPPYQQINGWYFIKHAASKGKTSENDVILMGISSGWIAKNVPSWSENEMKWTRIHGGIGRSLHVTKMIWPKLAPKMGCFSGPQNLVWLMRSSGPAWRFLRIQGGCLHFWTMWFFRFLGHSALKDSHGIPSPFGKVKHVQLISLTMTHRWEIWHPQVHSEAGRNEVLLEGRSCEITEQRVLGISLSRKNATHMGNQNRSNTCTKSYYITVSGEVLCVGGRD